MPTAIDHLNPPTGNIAELRRAVKGASQVMLNVAREDQGFIVVLR